MMPRPPDVDGVLVTDLIVEEAGEYLAEMESRGACADFSGCSDQSRRTAGSHRHSLKRFRLRHLARGHYRHAAEPDLRRSVAGRAHPAMDAKLPVAVGFGISNAEHVAQVAEFADAAVVGSAVVELIERSTPETAPGAVARFIKGLRLPQAALAR